MEGGTAGRRPGPPGDVWVQVPEPRRCENRQVSQHQAPRTADQLAPSHAAPDLLLSEQEAEIGGLSLGGGRPPPGPPGAPYLDQMIWGSNRDAGRALPLPGATDTCLTVSTSCGCHR